ncbi:hypothetical protein FWH09_03335 [Candidatus Saccharibacteria bacterium]|nr:hypothetical protein [Candidatus Saccharibacteria bacterium]
MKKYTITFDFGRGYGIGLGVGRDERSFDYIKENARQILNYHSDNKDALAIIQKMPIGSEERFYHGQHHEQGFPVSEYVYIKRVA